MRQYLTFILSIILMCFMSCTDVEDNADWSEEKIIEISPEIVPVNIFGTPNETDGMTIRIIGTTHSENVPTTFIEGFEFEPGYFHTLKIKITHIANQPLDSYNVRYELISVISKIKDENYKPLITE